jgi:4-phytase/acid phosphatase
MPLRRRPFPTLNLILRLVIALGAGGACVSSVALAAAEPESDLRLAILLTRHGVRSPLYGNDALGKFAAQPWPQWSVPVGILTPHGRQQMVLMGSYYRARFAAEGLLAGDTTADEPRVYFRADSDQRTRETGNDIAAGLLPGARPDMHARPLDKLDPLFRAAQLPIGHPDYSRGVAAVLGQIGGNPAAVQQACAAEFATLHRVLFGDSAPTGGKVDVRNLPAAVLPGERDHTVAITGPLRTAMQITDNLLLEYAEGMPMTDVGWGRLSAADLTQVLRLHSLYFNLTQGTFYTSQVQGSDLASHLLQTLDQAASGRADPGAFGSPDHRLVVIVGHDTNICNLGGLLGLAWWLPGTQPSPLLPGGALVFELRQRRSDRQFMVRTYYLSQSLEQMRSLEALSLQNPPAIAPIFVPGCSDPVPGYDAPLGRFEALLRRVIDPEFVLASPN